jgi:hypothetical protein
MWIEAQVYEQQMPLISDGQPVQITLVSQPGKVIEGKVLFVHPHLDPQTRTATVRIEIPNEDHSLRQGMYANVEILADTYHEAIVVPREAIIDTGRKQVAFVSTGEGRFEPRLLKLGSPGQDGTVQVLSGLKAGETVVTSGQFLLDSESRLQEAIAKFGSGEGQASATSAVPAKPEMEEGPAPMAVPHTDEMVVEYLKLWKQLGARQQGDTPVDPTPLIKAATLSATHAPADAKALVKKLEDAADEMRDKPIVEQRVAFLKVSAAAIDLVKHSRPSPAVGPTLYLIHCPMAFSEQGADWIQDTDKIANPFYATEMKKCGSVTETLTTSK